MWSEKAFPQTRESPAAMEMPDVMENINKAIQSSAPQNVLVLVKDGLSSKEFVMNARKFTYLRSLVIDHAQMFTNLREQFNVEAFESEYTTSKTYPIQSVEEVDLLTSTFANQLNTNETNYIVIPIHKTVATKDLDTIIEKLVKEAAKISP
jgi:hypothetical protein